MDLVFSARIPIVCTDMFNLCLLCSLVLSCMFIQHLQSPALSCFWLPVNPLLYPGFHGAYLTERAQAWPSAAWPLLRGRWGEGVIAGRNAGISQSMSAVCSCAGRQLLCMQTENICAAVFSKSMFVFDIIYKKVMRAELRGLGGRQMWPSRLISGLKRGRTSKLFLQVISREMPELKHFKLFTITSKPSPLL